MRSSQSKDPVVTFNTVDGPGDNPNYSPTLVGSQPTSVVAKNNRKLLNNLDNPLYTTNSNSCINIVSGYSLVSIAEDETIYYSNANNDGPIQNSSFYDSIKPFNVFMPVYRSQPVLNRAYSNDQTESAEYDYAEARSCIDLAKDKKSKARNCDVYEDYEFEQCTTNNV